jgi:hypothetical protein
LKCEACFEIGEVECSKARARKAGNKQSGADDLRMRVATIRSIAQDKTYSRG